MVSVLQSDARLWPAKMPNPAPKGHESNWVQSIPGKGWNVLLRL
jgi:hypothetical protein